MYQITKFVVSHHLNGISGPAWGTIGDHLCCHNSPSEPPISLNINGPGKT